MLSIVVASATLINEHIFCPCSWFLALLKQYFFSLILISKSSFYFLFVQYHSLSSFPVLCYLMLWFAYSYPRIQCSWHWRGKDAFATVPSNLQWHYVTIRHWRWERLPQSSSMYEARQGTDLRCRVASCFLRNKAKATNEKSQMLKCITKPGKY